MDAGHGGIHRGLYTTYPAKMHMFDDGLMVMEGVINRAIATLVRQQLMGLGIDHDAVYHEELDNSLASRVQKADKIYSQDKRAIYLSIHSNAGGGKGFEIFTSPGQTKSDSIAKIFCEVYQERFPQYPLRKDLSDGDADKEADFYVLRKTDCPAILLENLFFDNREEAEFLLSETGQKQIADCIVECILRTERQRPI